MASHVYTAGREYLVTAALTVEQMTELNRREFLVGSATAALVLKASGYGLGLGSALDSRLSSDGKPSPLLNYNCSTAIGLGDEPAGILDQFGQLRGRNAQVLLDLDSPLMPFQHEKWKSEDKLWEQWLDSGCLPIVRSKLSGERVSVDWTAFTSRHGGVKGDWIVVKNAQAPLRLRLLFPYATSVNVEGNQIIDRDKIVAFFPGAKTVRATSAKYNLLSPNSWCIDIPRWDYRIPLKNRPGLSPAFNSGRETYLNRKVEYRIPVHSAKIHHVYLGFITSQKTSAGEMLLKLSVNGESQIADLSTVRPDTPLVLEFAVAPDNGEIHIASACDVSSISMFRQCFLTGVWVFENSVDREELKTGKLDSRALVQIPCGREPLKDVAAIVELEYGAQSADGKSFFLPYDLQTRDAAKASGISWAEAEAAVREYWKAFLNTGAELQLGVPHLDKLYCTSLLNLLLLRTKYPGAGKDGDDLYVVKPGATIYDDFWTRDGSYIVTALDLAGHPDEAEKSLRLFWQDDRKGICATWGQQPAGSWQSPVTQWDSCGQALWALVNHYQMTGDKQWLQSAYGSIRKGGLWIQYACEQMKFTNENGERPTYYGLLPPGEGESIAEGINYYHDFWAVLGLRQAALAARALNQGADAETFHSVYRDLRANLTTSISAAFKRVATEKYIPATPFDPEASIWGSATALYPCRFLDPGDPMISATLAAISTHLEEDEYADKEGDISTYITSDIAMCHLLRNETDMFYRLFNGFVAHCSPTNAWVEGIHLRSRRGTGDMPHGWAAADYVSLHRNSLVYENENALELCWGVQPEWLLDGCMLYAKRAPTHFGILNFELRRRGAEIMVNYQLTRTGHAVPNQVRLHIPQLKEPVTTVIFNSRRIPTEAGKSVIHLI